MKEKFDLEERIALFGKNVIKFCRTIGHDVVTKPLISQIVRSVTSVGANYMEANGASLKKDFKNKIHICKKEIQETKYWLRMIFVASPSNAEEARVLWKEGQELTFIFGKIILTLSKSLEN